MGGSGGNRGDGADAADASNGSGGSGNGGGSGGHGGGSGGSGGSGGVVANDGGGDDGGRGDGSGDGADGGGSDGGRSDGGGAFAPVQAILNSSCVRCHDPAHPFVPETQTFVQMPLTPEAAYDALVGKPAHETCGGTLVTPGDADRSYLFHKVNDAKPCEGERMPHAGMLAGNNPLPDAALRTIADWIRGGALR